MTEQELAAVDVKRICTLQGPEVVVDAVADWLHDRDRALARILRRFSQKYRTRADSRRKWNQVVSGRERARLGMSRVGGNQR